MSYLYGEKTQIYASTFLFSLSTSLSTKQELVTVNLPRKFLPFFLSPVSEIRCYRLTIGTVLFL